MSGGLASGTGSIYLARYPRALSAIVMRTTHLFCRAHMVCALEIEMMMIQTYRNMQTLCGSQGARARKRAPGRSPGCRMPKGPLAKAAGSTSVFLGSDNLPRKEVIQPHLPVRLPCYDFTPLTLHTFDASPLTVGPAASGADDSGGVTGGVYKARERIHRGMLIRDY